MRICNMCIHYYKSNKGYDTCQNINVKELFIRDVFKNNKCPYFINTNIKERIEMKNNTKNKFIESLYKVIDRLKYIKHEKIIGNLEPIEQPICDIYLIKYKSCTNCPISKGEYKGCTSHITYIRVNDSNKTNTMIKERIKYINDVIDMSKDINATYFTKKNSHRFSNTISKL